MSTREKGPNELEFSDSLVHAAEAFADEEYQDAKKALTAALAKVNRELNGGDDE